MNPLGKLPESNSPQFSVNGLDWKKAGRMVLVQVGGLFLTMTVPWLLHFTYVVNGMDLTPIVVIVVNGAAEMVRRYFSGN